MFWNSIHAGAIQAAREKGGVEILWDGPAKEDQREEQQRIVERFTSEAVDAIVLAPCDRQTLVASVEGAVKKGIPVVIIDSGLEFSPTILDSGKYLGYVATDNRQGGVAAAGRMAALLQNRKNAKVLMLRYQAGSESTEQREAGFESALSKNDLIELYIPPDEAGATTDSAQKVAESLLQDNQDLDGIFTPNESSTIGMLQALRGLNRAGKVFHVGFDAGPILIDALRSDELHGLVMQDPFDMGYQSVMRAIVYLQQESMPTELTLHTNLRVATKDNLDDSDIKPLHSRDLSPFLD